MKLYQNEIYDEALEFYEQLQIIYNNSSKITNQSVNNTNVTNSDDRNNIAACNIVNVGTKTEILFNIAKCHYELCNYSDALKFLNRALDIFQNTALNPDEDRSIANTLGNIGICHRELCNYTPMH